MKNYRGFYKEAKGNLPHIYCDMDGVLTDFVLAAKRADRTELGKECDTDKIGNRLRIHRISGLTCLG